jgi:hypothetical protein
MGKNEPTAAPYGIPACGRTISGLVATTLDHAQKATVNTNAIATTAKPVFLRI